MLNERPNCHGGSSDPLSNRRLGCSFTVFAALLKGHSDIVLLLLTVQVNSQMNNVGFADHWKAFWGEHGLIGRDGIHPTLEGAELISI